MVLQYITMVNLDPANLQEGQNSKILKLLTKQQKIGAKLEKKNRGNWSLVETLLFGFGGFV